MQPLEALVREAVETATGASKHGTPMLHGEAPPGAALSGAEAEAARVLRICNGCRYCEGFCGTFQAMTRRLEFPKADLHYLANLCHNCGACLHACQYAPPHAFAINVPRAMAQVRGETYTEHAWPAALGRLYQKQGLTLALALAASLTLVLMLGVAAQGSWRQLIWHAPMAGDFYRIFPHSLMVALFAPVFGFAVVALGVGVARFWRAQDPGTLPADARRQAQTEAARHVLSLTYLGGGHGEGCHDEDDAFTERRRRAHHLTFWGFMLCFAATSVATAYHYLFGWVAPYSFNSAPKLLGVAGGIALTIGTAALWRLNLRRHPLHGDPAQKPMDRGFIALLFGTAVTGLVLTLMRGTGALALLLCIHLGFVMALFATLPYGKFAHGVYRTAALLKWAIERRQPLSLKLGSE
ncbi:MAG: tricarballylate utilization 4Fe-4S protein TcuB [Rubrivivax sp.]|jgi:citrate/tricarballylate utilization protein